MSASSFALAAILVLSTVNGVLGADVPSTVVPCDDPKIFLSPYVWNRTGHGDTARAEATTPGAYVRALVSGSATIGMVIDGTGNTGCPPGSMPAVEYTIDHGPIQTTQLSKTGEVYTLPLAEGLDASNSHQVDFYFRSADLGQKRWTLPLAHLRLAGLAIGPGAKLETCPLRPKRAVGFGDSITEGVGVERRFVNWSDTSMNNALYSWFPIVASALDCEYGQQGHSGLGMSRSLEIPKFPLSWDHYDAATSRLENGLLLPEPDYVFCCLGTNDPGLDPTADYLQWLAAARKACPQAKIFCIVPPLGVHRDEITKVVATRNAAGDHDVYLVDPIALNASFGPAKEGTALGYDGVHPTIYGQALLAAHILVATQKILDQGK